MKHTLKKKMSLWAVSTKGNAYVLPTNSSTWKQIENDGQCLRGFKKVAATSHGAWGLGCDHLVYVYVTESDVPIRVQEVTYENEVRMKLCFFNKNTTIKPCIFAALIYKWKSSQYAPSIKLL